MCKIQEKGYKIVENKDDNNTVHENRSRIWDEVKLPISKKKCGLMIMNMIQR